MIFILALFLLFKPLFPIAEYVFNYEYISKVLCVNKEKLALQCNGKCHLMKELAKSAEDEKPISDKKVMLKEVEILFCQAIQPILFTNFSIISTKENKTYYSNLYHYLASSSSFHPPSFIV